MNNKALLTTIIAILIIGSAFTMLIINYNAPTESKNEEIKGVSEIQEESRQKELWNFGIDNFRALNNRYSSSGTINGSVSRFGTSFEFQIEFEAFVDGENTEIKIFSDEEEIFIRSYNSKLYFSDKNTDQGWYLLDLSEVSNDVEQSLNLENITNLANLRGSFDDVDPGYLGSKTCGNEICQSYQVEINGRKAEIVINESSKSITQIVQDYNKNQVYITLAESSKIVEQPQNATTLNSSESQEKAQSAISSLVRSSIF